MPKIVMFHSVGRSESRYTVSVRVVSKVMEKKRMTLSFDDGYRDIFINAEHIFRRLSGRAIIFLVSGKIGGVNDWDSSGELAGKPLLNWEQMPPAQMHFLTRGARQNDESSVVRIQDPKIIDSYYGRYHFQFGGASHPIVTGEY